MFAPLTLLLAAAFQVGAGAPGSPSTPVNLTLEEALETALANDLGLQLEQVSSEISRYSFEGSWGS